jgi:hypothetical protein
MTNRRVSRSVQIENDVQTVAAFLSQPTNLPRWSRFFRAVTRTANGAYLADTVRGPGTTQVIVDSVLAEQIQLQIRTRFATTTETARLTVRELPAGCEVVFRLEFPPELPLTQRTHVLEMVEQDLTILRGLLHGTEIKAAS